MHPEPKADWTTLGVLLGVLSTVLAFGFAALGLWAQQLPRPIQVVSAAFRPVMRVLHHIHSGHVGDYVAWLFVGIAVLAGLVGIPLR